VIFACKTSLKIHRGTVSLLHRLGAYDGYIASQFQQHAALLALKGAFVGSGLAAGTMLVLHLMARNIDSPLFPSFGLSLDHWLILIALPVLMSLIALGSARLSVLGALRKMP
jgi:cell division transport system permease protein